MAQTDREQTRSRCGDVVGRQPVAHVPDGGATGQARREAAVQPGLERVGVHHIGAETADHAGQADGIHRHLDRAEHRAE